MAIVRNPVDAGTNDQAFDVFGDNGAEFYITQDGDRNVYMRGGDDTVVMDRQLIDDISQLRVFGGGGDDRITSYGQQTGQSAHGGGGNDYIALGTTAEGTSTGYGDAGDDVLVSQGAGVQLFGGPGRDTLFAHQDGDDLLNGGPGVDRFFLLSGDDTLRFFRGHTGTGNGRDIIYGFGDGGADVIDLNGMDANHLIVGNQDFTFLGETDKGSDPLAPGQVYHFDQGADRVVAWNNGAAREAVVLVGGADLDLSQSDFLL